MSNLSNSDHILMQAPTLAMLAGDLSECPICGEADPILCPHGADLVDRVAALDSEEQTDAARAILRPFSASHNPRHLFIAVRVDPEITGEHFPASATDLGEALAVAQTWRAVYPDCATIILPVGAILASDLWTAVDTYYRLTD